MFRIGDFSRLSQVSVKALRHYDEIGLPSFLGKEQTEDFFNYSPGSSYFF